MSDLIARFFYMSGIKGLICGVNNPALPERIIKATPAQSEQVNVTTL